MLEENVQFARDRARQLRVDPQLTITELYEAELLRRFQRRLRTRIVWKGGTVLRLEGSERFSRDLDATRRTDTLTRSQLKRIFKDVAEGLPHLTKIDVDTKPNSVVALYGFAVPGLRQPVRVEVEVSLREQILRPPVATSTARIAHPAGVEPVVVARLDDVELLAEKVRALVVRRASRDIYDVYWLLQRGVEFDADTFLRKMDYYRRAGRPVDPVRALQRAIADLETYDASRAKADLANLFPAAQRALDFSVIRDDVVRALRGWLASLQSDTRNGQRGEGEGPTANRKAARSR